MKLKLSKKAIASLVGIAKTNTDSFRSKLDDNVHIAEVSYSALKSSIPDITKEQHSSILEAFKAGAKVVSDDISHAVSLVKTSGWKGLVFVKSSSFGEFLLSVSYGALQRNVSDIIKSLEGIDRTASGIGKLIGIDKHGKTLARIGHIASSSQVSRTPLLEKLNEVYKRLPLQAANKFASRFIDQLKSAHTADITYAFDRTDITKKRTRSLTSILGRGVIFVTLQSDEKNADLAKLEADISREMVKYLESEEFINDLIVEPGSNSMVEDISHMILQELDSKVKPAPKHSKKAPTKGKSKVISTPKVKAFKRFSVRDYGGRFYSLTSLQSILNANLSDQIKKNMGTGRRRDILNLRTGRFAESVRVERLMEGKTGMVTAFYNYMKYPYQTFQPGFAQGHPASRDPKLLISRSIREIVSKQISNRLRSVLV